jgi:CubicO group peptidase (beta-lactamase class C family)
MTSSSRVHIEYTSASSRLSPAVRNSLASVLVATTESGFPAGFNLAVVDRSDVLLRAWGGFANLVGEKAETQPDTLYDLASLTKVVVATTLALWLEDQKLWKLDQSVSHWLPEFTRSDITLRQLLTHTSGIIPHRPFFHLGRRPSAVRKAVFTEAALAGPAGTVSYSDLNFMLLGWAIERCVNEPLDRLFARVVTEPLAMTDTRFQLRARDRSRAAATELDGDQRLEPGLVRGEVHDGNAWSLGGVSGHAGLFSSTSDLTIFVQAMLNPRHHPVLSAAAQARMARPHAGRQPDVRGLGWQVEPRAWGKWPEGTLWHTGFTGTSLLISPRANIGVVLLANGVHPLRKLDEQTAFRTAVHRAIAKGNS